MAIEKEKLEKFTKARSKSLEKRIAEEKASPDYKKLVATYGGLTDEPKGWNPRWQKDYLEELIRNPDQQNLITDAVGDHLGVMGGSNKDTDFHFSDIIPTDRLRNQVFHWIDNHGSSKDVPNEVWSKIQDNQRKRMYMDYRSIRPGPPENRLQDKLTGYENYFPVGSESWRDEMTKRYTPGRGGYIEYGEDFPTTEQMDSIYGSSRSKFPVKTQEELRRIDEERGGGSQYVYQNWQPWKGPSEGGDLTKMEGMSPEETRLSQKKGFEEWMATGQDAKRLKRMAGEGEDWVGKNDWYWNERLKLHKSYKDWDMWNPDFDHTNQSPFIQTPEAKIPESRQFYKPTEASSSYKFPRGMSADETRFMVDLIKENARQNSLSEAGKKLERTLSGLTTEERKEMLKVYSEQIEKLTPEQREKLRKFLLKHEKEKPERTTRYRPPWIEERKKPSQPELDWLDKEPPIRSPAPAPERPAAPGRTAAPEWHPDPGAWNRLSGGPIP